MSSRYHVLIDERRRRWQSLHFKQNPYKPENKIYETKRGEIVRSKSEALIADILFYLRIPYHYEMPLKLGKGIIRYPDFTILKNKTREVYYFEHFGMMDNDEYRSKCFDKIDEYRKKGIYSGKNLIVTFETENIHLDIKGIREILRILLVKHHCCHFITNVFL